jgi:precorrin-6Y C5,15-methyltransferase (decarboxylating)
MLFGSPRHFDLIPQLPDQQRLPWPTPLRAGLPSLLNQVAGRRVVALASGDPLVAGIGSTLFDLLGPDVVRIHPEVSSVALARARMGWPERAPSWCGCVAAISMLCVGICSRVNA